MTMRTAIGCGAAAVGTGLHLLTAAGHPMLAGAIGGAAVAWPAVRDYRERRRPVDDIQAVDEAADVEVPAAVAA